MDLDFKKYVLKKLIVLYKYVVMEIIKFYLIVIMCDLKKL